MAQSLTSVTTAESQYYGAFMKSSSLAKVPDLYKEISQKAVSDKEVLTVPFRSKTAVFDRNMDVLDISQQAYLLKTGYQKPEKESESLADLWKTEKKESPLTYSPVSVTQKKENAAVYGALLNTQNKGEAGIPVEGLTNKQTIGQEKGVNNQVKTGIGFDAYF